MPSTQNGRAPGRAPRRVLSAGVVLALLLGLFTVAAATPASAATRPSAPAKAWVRTNSYGKFELAWKAGAHATKYKVIVATDKSMDKVVFTKLTRKRAAWVYGTRIKEGNRYYYRVRSYNGTKAGGQTEVRSMRPLVKPVKKPEGLVVKHVDTSSVFVDWSAAELATGYTVKLRGTKYGTPFWSRRTTGTSMTVPSDRRVFFVTVTAYRFRRTFRDSETVVAATSQPVPAGSRAFTADVGSYNVMQYNLHTTDHPWRGRRQAAADLIRDLDVVGVHEATWGAVLPAMGGMSGNDAKRPVTQLAHLALLKVAMRPDGSGYPCGTHSVHVLYRASMFTLTSCGEAGLDSDHRYVTWAVLKHRASGASVFAATTHLADGSTANAERATQTRRALEVIKARNGAGLPMILTGDLNSFHGRAGTTPLSLFMGGGFYAADLVAPSLVNGSYASTHGFKATPRNGYRVDHVLTSKAVRTTRFAVRRTTESTAPSDHHPVAATVDVHS